MQGVDPPSRSPGGRSPWLGPALVLVLGGLAYHALLRSLVGSPSSAGIEDVFFRPGELPTLVVVGVAGWLLWNRRERLGAAPPGSAPILVTVAGALGTALFVWAHLTRAFDLLLPSLAATGLALAALWRGRNGFRAGLLPALVLTLGIAVPTPLRDELVWQLQRASAATAAWMLERLDWEILHNGVIIQSADHTFQVIDACSGFSGIAILILTALIVRELFASAGRRPWLVLLLAPPLGFVLNAARIAAVAASSNPEALAGLEGDHTPQGLAVLAVGAGALYAFGWWTSRSGDASRTSGATRATDGVSPLRGWPFAAAWLAGLATLSFTLSPFDTPKPGVSRVSFPKEGGGWTSEGLPVDPFFVGAGMGGEALYRRYDQTGTGATGNQGVEIFVGQEIERLSTSSALLSSKRRWPGPDWNQVRRGRTRIWALDREADLVLTSRRPGGEHAVVYVWRLRDEGLWRESWRSLLALEASPFRRQGRRTVVRLTTFAPHGGQLILDQAKRRLDRFVKAFRVGLAGL